MSRTTHTLTVTFSVESNAGDPTAPAGSVDLDIEAIEVDGEDVCLLTTKATQAEVERHIRSALNILGE